MSDEQMHDDILTISGNQIEDRGGWIVLPVLPVFTPFLRGLIVPSQLNVSLPVPTTAHFKPLHLPHSLSGSNDVNSGPLLFPSRFPFVQSSLQIASTTSYYNHSVYGSYHIVESMDFGQ
jgi:hypothetical protein